jgi:hypothetical protein
MEPVGTSLEERLAQLDMKHEVFDAATRLCGSEERALQWFYNDKVKDLGNETPFHLVLSGKGRAVLDYIESLGAGALG